MELTDAVAYTEKCFNGEPAPCSFACPLSVDVRSQMEKVGKGRWNAAYKSLRSAVLFPMIVSVLCPAPCEADCLRKQTGDDPLSVKMIEGACVSYAKTRKPDKYVLPPKTERIAVIGAGIAGLSAALCLAQKNFIVTVFEKSDRWGGSLCSHSRFSEFDDDISTQFTVVELDFRFGVEIKSLDELNEYDLVYIATGSGGDDFGLRPGWDGSSLMTSKPGVFMGGSVTGAGVIEAIAQGKAFSKTAEVFLQTGKISDTINEDKGVVCKIDCSNEPPFARVAPEGEDGFSEEEAKTEASRCFLCDCNMCMTSCEMLDSFRKKPKKMSMEVYADIISMPPYSTHTITRQTFSCNMCGHCKAICPNDVDIGALMKASRSARVDSGTYPAAYHDYWLREMDFSTNEALFYHKGKEDNPEYVFFPGCQLGAHNPEYVIRSYDFLKTYYNAGIYLSCCGAPAYWAGDDKRMSNNIEQILNVRSELGNPVFVLACATCESVFNELVPEIECISLYELLAGSKEISPASAYKKASVFDPCNSRKNPEMETAVRAVAQRADIALDELPEQNRCCGYGGHIRLANGALYDKIAGKRMGMSENPYITYCVNCREVFLSGGKECAHILNIAFDIPNGEGVPKIDKKRKNAMEVKRIMDIEYNGKETATRRNEWDYLELVIGEELADNIDKKLIAGSDVKEAIWLAEQNDDKFIDEENGVCHCSMEKPALTYWVQYKKVRDGVFEVYGAYSHRMRIGAQEV